MSAVAAQFLDGDHLAARPAGLSREGDHLVVAGDGFRHEYPLGAIRVSDRLGRIPRYLYLPGGATIATDEHDAVDAMLPATRRTRLAQLLHWLESRASFAAAATVLLGASIIVTTIFGLPVAARHLAHQLPEVLDRKAGEVALAAMARFTYPTELSAPRRREITQLAADLATARGLTAPRVEFRSMGGKYPNAFALPGRIIVVTDELVEVAGSDGEIQAVLAHELGHVRHRHSLQGVLRGSAALLVVTLVSGDLSVLTSFSATIPFMLLQRGYSREFEREADDYAVETLRLAGGDVVDFAVILQKLETSREGMAVDYSYLSTHPHTDDRIRRIAGDAPGIAERLEAARAPKTEPPPPPLIQTSTFTPKRGPTANLRPGRAQVLPMVREQPGPEYPPLLRAAGIEGKVLIQFVVDADGNVQQPEVLQSDHEGFNAAAQAAVAKWKFRPGTLDGRPVNTQLSVPIHFNLEKEVPIFQPPSLPNR